MYYKRIVCDIDDTISITLNRDWENAEPIKSTINKLIQFRDLGWEIWLVTARGQLSCGGDHEAADKKYRAQMERWLHDHNVPFDVLSFNKPLATYYVDDKALTPQQFQQLSVRKLEGGWGNSDIELRDGRVYKTAENSIDASTWYDIAAPFVKVPKIYSLIGKTICMQYVDNNSVPSIHELIRTIRAFSQIQIDSCSDFVDYCGRLQRHAHATGKFHDALPVITEDTGLEQFCNRHKSFCHGDFSLENILVEDGVHYFIDPIYEPDRKSYSSYLLDISKLLYSYRNHKRTLEFNYLLQHYTRTISDPFASNDRTLRYLLALEVSQWIRVYKYAPAKHKPRIEQTIYQLIENITKN